jgi:hypothetical protein
MENKEVKSQLLPESARLLLGSEFQADDYKAIGCHRLLEKREPGLRFMSSRFRRSVSVQPRETAGVVGPRRWCGVQRLLIGRQQAHAVDANRTQYGHFLQASSGGHLSPSSHRCNREAKHTKHGKYCMETFMLSKVYSWCLLRSSNYHTLYAFYTRTIYNLSQSRSLSRSQRPPRRLCLGLVAIKHKHKQLFPANT